jgi:hypothetical protein
MKKLLKIFKNRFVTITIKSVRTRNANMQFVGFFLDEDKDFIYLGETPDGEIHAAIPKSENAGIVLTDELNFLMDQIDIPGDQGVQ